MRKSTNVEQRPMTPRQMPAMPMPKPKPSMKPMMPPTSKPKKIK